MNHPLRNFQRGPTWSSNNDPLVTSNRIMDDFQFLPGRGMKSIVDRDSGTIGILECCSTTTVRRHDTVFGPYGLLDLVTKKTRPLTHLAGLATMRSFDITPDRKHIVFDRLRDNSDVVLIELPK